MEVPRAQPKPPGDDPVALRWPFAKRHAAEQPPLVEPRGCLKDKKQWESGHTAYKPCLEEPLVLILGRAPSPINSQIVFEKVINPKNEDVRLLSNLKRTFFLVRPSV